MIKRVDLTMDTPIAHAVEAGFDYWSWWDNYDGDTMARSDDVRDAAWLRVYPFIRHIPGYEEMTNAIVEGTRYASLDDVHRQELNEALFLLAAGEDAVGQNRRVTELIEVICKEGEI